MTLKDVLWISGLISALVIAIVIIKCWGEWRNRTLTKAAAALGFRRARRGESIPIVLVPLINRAGRTYSIILLGTIQGFEAAFFDLLTTSGRNWDYQSTVLVKTPNVLMPRFQLMRRQLMAANQRTCGDALQ